MRIPLRAAIKAASRSKHPEYWHSAILLRGGAIVAQGWNQNHRHAEAVALGKLWPSKRVGTTLISLRVDRDGKLAMARPCAACQRLLEASGVSRIYYSNRQGEVILL